MKPLDICEMQDRITQLAKDYNEVARDNRYMSLRTSELLCELAETKELVERLEQELEIANEGLTVAYMSGAAEAKKELNALKGKLDNTFLISGATVREIQAQAIEDAGLEYMRQHALSSGNPVTLFLKQRAKQLREGGES